MGMTATRARPPALASSDELDWSNYGTCRHNPDAWSGHTRSNSATLPLTVHLCGHCPVITQCGQAATNTPPSRRLGSVWAGVYYDVTTGLADPADQPKATTCTICAAPKPEPALEVCARDDCYRQFPATHHRRKYCSNRCQRWMWWQRKLARQNAAASQ